MLGQLIIAIRKAARMRGLELNEDQIEGLALALREYDPDDVMASTIRLWQSAEHRGLPTPKEIAVELRDRRRKASEQAILATEGMIIYRPPTDAELEHVKLILAADRDYTLGRTDRPAFIALIASAGKQLTGPAS